MLFLQDHGSLFFGSFFPVSAISGTPCGAWTPHLIAAVPLACCVEFRDGGRLHVFPGVVQESLDESSKDLIAVNQTVYLFPDYLPHHLHFPSTVCGNAGEQFIFFFK